MPDDSRICSKNPKKEKINSKKRTYKKKMIWRNNIVQTSSPENQISKKESNNQNGNIHHHYNPAGQITEIMNVKSQISSRKIF